VIISIILLSTNVIIEPIHNYFQASQATEKESSGKPISLSLYVYIHCNLNDFFIIK